MVAPEDQKESTPFGREFGLRIPDEYQGVGLILMSQFKAEAVGFEVDMAGEHIEKRRNGKPEEGQQKHDERK